MIGDAAGDGGEVGVRGWEEVEGDVGGEDFLREGGGEEGGEAGLEDSEGWVVSGLLCEVPCVREHLLFPNFNVRSSGGATSLNRFIPGSPGA